MMLSFRRRPGKQHQISRFLFLLALLGVSLSFIGSEAFSPSSGVSLAFNLDVASTRHGATTYPVHRPNVALQLSSNQFDVSKPVFDILSVRSVRGDAIVRYDSLNQSEPLRINIFGIMTLVFLAAPTLNEALGGDSMGLIGTVRSILISMASLALFLRECQRRSQQLTRIEKELNSEYLAVRLTTNVLADMPFSKAVSLGDLRRTSAPPRIIALCGTGEQIREAMVLLCVLGRRLQQASTFVVPVPTDGSSRSDWNLGSTKSLSWLAEPSDLVSWQSYFDDLSSGVDTKGFRWFGLNSNGRSFGSGTGEVPQWLEVMGQHLRPTVILDVDDNGRSSGDGEVSNVLEAQRCFYEALTSGGEDAMEKIQSSAPSSQVSDVIESGGRVDDWTACLAEGARPEGMQTSGCDAFILSDGVAYSSVVEFPVNTGLDDATLLAVQQWVKVDDDWKLQLHQTIPWNTASKARGTLRCDCRGCVALTRGDERRSFGGLIG